MHARYMDPQIGRFVSQDSGHDGSNWFTYCNNEPINNVDASGKSALSVTDWGAVIAGLILMSVFANESPLFALMASAWVMAFALDSLMISSSTMTKAQAVAMTALALGISNTVTAGMMGKGAEVGMGNIKSFWEGYAAMIATTAIMLDHEVDSLP